MKKINIFGAYVWAAACLLLIPVTFIKNDTLSQQFARLPFMKVHPRYSGGEERISYIADSMNIAINRPVYDGLLGKGINGFVQIRFREIGKLPDQIDQSIDYDINGTPDFTVSVNTITGVTNIVPLSSHIRSLNVSSRVKQDWVVRVNVVR